MNTLYQFRVPAEMELLVEEFIKVRTKELGYPMKRADALRTLVIDGLRENKKKSNE